MAETHKGFGLLFEMGCGKTLTAIMIAGTAYQMGKVEKVLVVAPTSVCSVWPKDFAEFADFKANIKVLLGDKNRRLKLLNDLDNFPFKALKVAVINYESTWREGIFDALYEWNADMIICDESQRIKSHDAEQSKAMHKLGDQAKYKLILSGTPVQNNAIDLYSQYRFLDPTIFGTNFYQFRNRYAIMGGFNRHQIVGYKDLDQLIQKEHSIAYRVTKDEALDLPEQTFLQRYITMSAKEKNIYDRIKRESFAELESGGQISATTVLTKLLRLQQFTGGFLVADGEEKPELVSKGKLNALEEIVDDYVVDTGKKLVIFARFRTGDRHHRADAEKEETPLRRNLWRCETGGQGRHRQGLPDEPGNNGIPRTDRYRRTGNHTYGRRHLCVLFGQLQLCSIQSEPCQNPPYRAKECLHLYPPHHRGNDRRSGAESTGKERGSGKNSRRYMEGLFLMAALDSKSVNTKSVETAKLNCIQKVGSANNKRLWQLNKAYREAEHDLQLMESIGAISKKEVEETMDKMRFHYVKLGLEMRDGYED